MSTKADQLDPWSFKDRFVTTTSGHVYQLIDEAPLARAGPAPTAILFHGFPDLPYGWRYQIRDLQARGYRVLAPYMLGYGGTSKPTNIEAYSMKSMSYDLASLLDQVGVKGKVFVLGHDWGGQMAWRFVNYFPERVHCVAVVCTPYSKPSTPSTPLMTDDFLEKHVPNFGYQLYFKTPEAIDEISEVVDLFLQPMHSPNLRRQQAVPEEGKMGNWVKKGRLQASIQRQIAARRAGKLPPPLPEAELDHYIDTFNKGGMAGPLAWYKTRAVNHHEEVAHNHDPFPPHIPALLLSATLDAALPPSMATSKSVLGAFPAGNLEVRFVEGADHWLLQDERVEPKVTAALGDWLDLVKAGGWKPAGPGLSKL